MSDHTLAACLKELNTELLKRLKESTELIQSLRQSLRAYEETNERHRIEAASPVNSDDDQLGDIRRDSVLVYTETHIDGIHQTQVAEEGGQQETEHDELR
jgi:hypothetical protein